MSPLDPSFVNTNEVKSLEQYAAALLTSMLSIKTLEAFHITAYNEGILDEDDAELSKTICWELRRLMGLYTQMINSVCEKVPDLEEEKLLQTLRTMAGIVAEPRPKRERTKTIRKKRG